MERQTDNRQTAIAEVDARLVKSILDGNRVGFRMLINRHATTVRMFVARFIPLLEDEEEVTQDVFMKAYESLQRFDGDKANFKTWLLRIAYHAVLKHLRHEPRLEFVELEGLHLDKAILCRKAKKVEIESVNLVEDFPVELDGDVVAATPLTLEIMDRPLQFIP